MASFPAALRAPARSAYRGVLRAARITFHGDPTRRLALENTARLTFSSPTLTSPQARTSQDTLAAETLGSDALLQPQHAGADAGVGDGTQSVGESSEAELRQRIDEWVEVARFLRRNVVQGVQDEEEGAYRLRLTRDTELGNNEDIRTPPKLPNTPFPNRNKQPKPAHADTGSTTVKR